MGMDQRAFYVEKWDKWRHRKPLGYWRKNGWLDDWMTNLRRDRGEDDFFGWMELSKEDIEKLHLEIVAGQLALRKSSEKEYYDSGFMSVALSG